MTGISLGAACSSSRRRAFCASVLLGFIPQLCGHRSACWTSEKQPFKKPLIRSLNLGVHLPIVERRPGHGDHGGIDVSRAHAWPIHAMQHPKKEAVVGRETHIIALLDDGDFLLAQAA